MDNNIYPDFPAIALHFDVAVEDIEQYQKWHSCFFVKIANIGWRFVSLTFTRIKIVVRQVIKKTAKLAESIFNQKGYLNTIEEQQKWESSKFRVIKTWDNGSRYIGDRVISVLIQNVRCNEKPWWASVFDHQKISRGDILGVGSNGNSFYKIEE